MTSLSETDADHLETFWDANAGNPIKREARNKRQKHSPKKRVNEIELNRLRRRFVTANQHTRTTPGTPIRLDEHTFGTSAKPPSFSLNSAGGKAALNSVDDKGTPVAGGTPPDSEADNNTAAGPVTANTLNGSDGNGTGPDVPPLGLNGEGDNGTGSNVPPPPQRPPTDNGTGPAQAPDVPPILYVDECARPSDGKSTYDAIMLHKANKWWFVVPRKGGLYENKVCKLSLIHISEPTRPY